MKFQRTPLLEKCWTFTQKTVSAHRKQVSGAAGNSTFWQHFVNIENLLIGKMDLYKIWWQCSKYSKACAHLIMCNTVQVCTCQSQTFGGGVTWDSLYLLTLLYMEWPTDHWWRSFYTYFLYNNIWKSRFMALENSEFFSFFGHLDWYLIRQLSQHLKLQMLDMKHNTETYSQFHACKVRG